MYSSRIALHGPNCFVTFCYGTNETTQDITFLKKVNVYTLSPEQHGQS